MNFEDAWEVLAPNMLKRAKKATRVIGNTPVADNDDLVSLAMLAVWEACLSASNPEDIRRYAHHRFSHLVWRLAFDISPLRFPTSTRHFKNAVSVSSTSLDALTEVAGDFLVAPANTDLADVEIDALLKQTAANEQQYEIARLHIIGGYKLPEVASLLHLPVANVRRQWNQFLRRARQRW